MAHLPRSFGLALMAISISAGAQQAPLSFIDGMPLTRTDHQLFPLRVVSIDGTLHFSPSDTRISIYPGQHELVLAAGRYPGNPVEQTQSFTVKPCTHYHLAARIQSYRRTAPWELVIDREEEVAGCNPEEELRKAAQQAKSQSPAPAATPAAAGAS